MRGVRCMAAILGGVLVLAALPPAARGSSAGVDRPVAVRTTPVPPEALRLHARHFGAVQPSVRFWILVEARKLKDAPLAEVTEASLAGIVRARFAGQPMGPDDVSTLVALILVEANKAAEADLKALADKQKAALEAKKRLRDLQALLDRQVADASGKPDSAPCVPPACGKLGLAETSAAVHRTSGRIALPATEPTNLRELRAVAAELKDRKDSLSELGDMESLRLQMAMDRMSKFMSTLSNIMKKMSDTSQSIVQNLK